MSANKTAVECPHLPYSLSTTSDKMLTIFVRVIRISNKNMSKPYKAAYARQVNFPKIWGKGFPLMGWALVVSDGGVNEYTKPSDIHYNFAAY